MTCSAPIANVSTTDAEIGAEDYVTESIKCRRVGPWVGRSPRRRRSVTLVERIETVGGIETVATIKTKPTGSDVTAFLDAVPNERCRAEGHEVCALFERVTGAPAVMWGPSIVGFGSKPYTNTTGTNEWFIVGFSPRANALTLYGIHDGYGPADPLLQQLGPHTTGKGCLYLKRLSEVDREVLERLVVQAWRNANDGSAT